MEVLVNNQFLLEYLQKSLDKIYQSIDIPIPQVNIVRCKYDNDSNLIGALANYKKIYNWLIILD